MGSVLAHALAGRDARAPSLKGPYFDMQVGIREGSRGDEAAAAFRLLTAVYRLLPAYIFDFHSAMRFSRSAMVGASTPELGAFAIWSAFSAVATASAFLPMPASTRAFV